MALPRWLTDPTPGFSLGITRKAKEGGKAFSNPSQNSSAKAGPQTTVLRTPSNPGPISVYKSVTPPSLPKTGQVKGASTGTSNNSKIVNGGAGNDFNTNGANGSLGGGTYDPNDPNSKESIAKRSVIQGVWNTLKSVYDGMFGDVDNVVKDKASQLQKTYDDQTNQVQNDYTKTAAQQANVYGGRGLGSSSYYQDAQKDASDTLQNTVNSLIQDQQAKQGELGQYASTTKAGINASKQSLEPYVGQLGQYGLQDLSSLEGNFNSALQGAQQQRAGLKTNSQFVQDLNNISPMQQQGSAQLQSKLQNLINSSAPASAKKYIASGLIKAGTMGDQTQSSYWENYFNQLLGSGQ